MSGNRDDEGDRSCVSEPAVPTSYHDVYSEDGMSIHFVEWAYEWNLLFGTDLYAIQSSDEGRPLAAGKDEDKIMPKVPTKRGELNFEGSLTAEEIERAGVRENCVQCRAHVVASRW